MITHGLNGLYCLGFVILVFGVLIAVGLRNSLNERKAQDPASDLPGYGRAARVTRVTRGAQVPREASKIHVDA